MTARLAQTANRQELLQTTPESGGALAEGRGGGLEAQSGAHGLRSKLWVLQSAQRIEEVAEPADKPGSVWSSHSSRRNVTVTLEQPTRTRRGQRHEVPIWPCSRWGLPCRPVARLAVRSYRTISPLPDPAAPESAMGHRRYLSVALSVGSRRPGVTWHRALWSPDFPRHRQPPKWLQMTRLSGRLRRGHCRMAARLGSHVHFSCLGFALLLPSLLPFTGEGEEMGTMARILLILILLTSGFFLFLR